MGPLHAAVAGDDLPSAAMLLKAGARVNASPGGTAPLEGTNDAAMTTYLVACGADPAAKRTLADTFFLPDIDRSQQSFGA